jgi:bifunctional non-homologous end joining protein LigD
MTQRNQSVTLFYTDASSDKQYAAALTEHDQGLFTVTFAYGRRGSAQTPGTKTPTPLPYDKALKVYQGLVNAKVAKGYSPTAGAAAYQDTSLSGRASGLAPMLLNPIEESDLASFLLDDTYVLQAKEDGERRLLVVTDDGVVGVNRRGLTIALSQRLADGVRALGLAPDTILDGEDLGSTFIAFDVLQAAGRCVRQRAYDERLAILDSLLAGAPPDNPIVRSFTYRSAPQKAAMLDHLRELRAEGVVFKDRFACYVPGRPASGGVARKFKFLASATVIVGAANEGKRSVPMYVLGKDGAEVFVGNCTVPANAPVPAPGTLLDVGYLYSTGAALFQPTWGRVRTDLDQADTFASLKLKAGVQAQAA